MSPRKLKFVQASLERKTLQSQTADLILATLAHRRYDPAVGVRIIPVLGFHFGLDQMLLMILPCRAPPHAMPSARLCQGHDNLVRPVERAGRS